MSGDRLPRPSVSALKARSQALIPRKKKLQILGDIEIGLRSLESNLRDGHPSSGSKVISISNPLQGVVEYGRLLEEVVRLLRHESLTSLGNILRSDALYLNGRNLDSLDISEQSGDIQSEEIEGIVARLTRLEEWLEV